MNAQKSTPIESLPNNDMPKTEDNELVDNILKEINDEPQNTPDMQALAYQMDTQTKMDEVNRMNLNDQMNSMPQLDNMMQDQLSEEVSLTQKIINHLKNPLTVAVITLMLSLPMTTDFITKYVPKTVDSITNNINMLGLLFKSILAGIIYYALNQFL